MTDEQIRNNILEKAYRSLNSQTKKWSVVPGLFNIFDISKDWGETRKRVKFNADYLHQNGLVVWHGFVKGEKEKVRGMTITANGIDKYEREHNEKLCK